MPEIAQSSSLIFVSPKADANLNKLPSSLNQEKQVDITRTEVKLSINVNNNGFVPADNVFASDFKPAWSEKIKKTIATNFNQGLKTYRTTPEELTAILKAHNLGTMEINLTNVQDPAYAGEIKKIQEKLNCRFNNSEYKELGIAHSQVPNGIFNKSTISLLLALKESNRGEAVNLEIQPIKQETKTGCFRSSEAMYFNFLHKKDGTPDAYTESDIFERLSEPDRKRNDLTAGVKSEDLKGRVSFPKSKGINLLNDIDTQLNNNPPLPVIVGVSHKKQEEGQKYNEGYTDHFVLITGRGYDDNGLFYSFNDPAQGGRNKFRFDPSTGKLSAKGDMAGIYDLTMVSVNENDPGAIEKYKKIGRTVFSPGESLPEIKDIQWELNLLGFKISKIDGNFSDKTVNAVKEFQEVRNLPDTGTIDTNTRDAIESYFRDFQKINPARVIFKTGDKSPKLTELQRKLNDLGFKIKPATSQFGPGTVKAVIAFQKVNNLPVTGQLDNQTWLKIEETCTNK